MTSVEEQLNFGLKLPDARLVLRNKFILEKCKGKRVLHVGCVDAGFLEHRISTGELVHLQIMAVAKDVWGVDVDQAGIDLMKDKGIPNLIAVDGAYIGDIKALQSQTFDVVIASEVVEHMSNPGLFFDSIKKLCNKQTELIITVPNAFSLRGMAFMLFRRTEWVHPDHNYWFSYRTITSIMRKHGYEINDVLVAVWQEVKPFSWRGLGKYLVARLIRLMSYSFYRLNPFLGNGLIVSAYIK